MARAAFAFYLALALAPVFAACDVVGSGDEGNLEFELVSSDRIVPVSFGTPLAAGLSVDVKVYVAGGDRTPATVNLAQPKDQTIAVVSATGSSDFTLRGKVAGTTTVDVVSAAGNDSFELAVHEITRVVLLLPGRVLVPQSPPVRVVQGGSAHFSFTLQDSDSRQLIGYGALPVDVAPASAASVVETHSAGLLTVAFTDLGRVTLTPQGAAAVEVTVVPASDIATLAFAAPDGGSVRTVEVGKVTTVVLQADNAAAEPILGLTDLIAVTTSTPQVCSVAQSAVLGDAVFQVTGRTAGTCEIGAALGALSAAATVEVQ